MFRYVGCLVLSFVAVGLVFTVGCASTEKSTSAPAPVNRAQAADDLFTRLDINGDGVLTKSELRDGLRWTVANYDRPHGEMFALEKGAKARAPRQASRKPTNADVDNVLARVEKGTDGAVKEKLTREEFKKIVISTQKDPNDPFEPFL